MDVRCSRCGTEYDFDDALVSERGTTVKCTNCGHQFKVYSGAAGGAAPERWVVRKSSGRELVYTSLRDLQRAIAQKQVGPADHLSRDGHPPRALHTIAELDPFFQAQGRGRTTPRRSCAPTQLRLRPAAFAERPRRLRLRAHCPQVRNTGLRKTSRRPFDATRLRNRHLKRRARSARRYSARTARQGSPPRQSRAPSFMLHLPSRTTG
jgi:predicted Zn finger-like uncharacterized protein